MSQKNQTKSTSSSKLGILAVLVALSIGLGAIGAHALKGVLSEKLMSSYQTATTYLWIQTTVLFVLHLLKDKLPNNAGANLNLILAGTLMFSFSIYGLIFFKSMGWAYSIFVPITPLGGVTLILGWLLLAISFFRRG